MQQHKKDTTNLNTREHTKHAYPDNYLQEIIPILYATFLSADRIDR
jgi:hypothetical protein